MIQVWVDFNDIHRAGTDLVRGVLNEWLAVGTRVQLVDYDGTVSVTGVLQENRAGASGRPVGTFRVLPPWQDHPLPLERPQGGPQAGLRGGMWGW